MKLTECIRTLVLKEIIGNPDIEITGMEIDSRDIQPGNLFIALRGHSVDGHHSMRQAALQGAAAIVAEEPMTDIAIPMVIVPDTNRAMALIATMFYRYPTQELRLIGVTGTNGKTTTTKMIETILSNAGNRTGLIGTMHMKIGQKEFKVKNTTPDAVSLQKSFRSMCDAGCKHAVIEVSSHALNMGRTWGCHFQTAVFTNLTQDHLDYHPTMEHYRDAKGLLFSQLSFGHCAVLNADDPTSAHFAHMTPAQVITYGIHHFADVRAEEIRITGTGTSFVLHTFKGTTEINMKMIGQFNIYNALAAITVGLLEGVALEQVVKSISEIEGVSGRFETINEGQSFTVIVDYSHTSDSLENALTTIREFAKGNIICVVGCGGDRDRLKRPMMARIATQHSEYAIFTSDNPRTEDPNMILLEMVNGVMDISSNYTCIIDRKEAIYEAVHRARDNDIILIAGKGHETYQEIDGVRHDFDDREVARSAIRDKNGDRYATEL